MRFYGANLLKIMVLRKAGVEDSQISSVLGYSEFCIKKQEETFRRKYLDDQREDLHEKIGVSKKSLDELIEFYGGGLQDNGSDNGLENVPVELDAPSLKENEVDYIEKGRDILLNVGAFSIKDFAEKIDCNYGKARNILKEIGVELIPIRKQREYKLWELAKQGKSFEEIVEEMNLTYNYVLILSRGLEIRKKLKLLSQNFRVRKYKDPEMIAKIGGLVQEGLSLVDMGRELDKSPESIGQYVKRHDLHETWREKRRQAKIDEKNKKGNLVEIVNSVINFRLNEFEGNERWIAEKSVEYNSKHSRASYEKLLKIFEAYKKALDDGEQVTFLEFQERTGINYGYISDVLRNSGLKDLSQRKKREIAPRWKKHAVEDSDLTDFGLGDLAYFLNLPNYVVSGILRRNSLQKKKKPVKIFFRGDGGGVGIKRVLDYHLASQIYEAIDAGFKNEEVKELLDIDDNVLNYTIRRREPISKKICDSLRILFENDNITKPYLDGRFRNALRLFEAVHNLYEN